MHRRQHEDKEEVIKRNADFARIILNNDQKDNLSLNGTTAPFNHSTHSRRLKMQRVYEPAVQVEVPSLSYGDVQEAKQVEWHREELKALSARLGIRKRPTLDLQAEKADTSLDDDEEALIDAYLGTYSFAYPFHFLLLCNVIKLMYLHNPHGNIQNLLSTYALLFLKF